MKRTTDPKVAVGYIRVSTDEQDLGPEAQRQALDQFVRQHGMHLVAVHVDKGVSGAAPLERRPGLIAALESMEVCKAGVLLVAKRDRLARDVMLAAMIERLAERAGAVVHSADGTGNGSGPADMLLRGIVDVFAQYERALIRARTRAALAVKRSRGERVGSVPYGSREVLDGSGRLEVYQEEAEAVAMAKVMRAEGKSLRCIARALTAAGMPCRGKSWHQMTVARITAT